MKYLLFTSLLIFISRVLFAQSVNFETTAKLEVKTNIKGSYSKLALYEEKYLIAVSGEETTIYELSTGKKKGSVVFPGSYDKIWISKDGKYAAGTTQQYSPPDKKQINVNGFHYYDFATGKLDSYSITDERLISDIDFSRNTTDILLVYTSAVKNSDKTNHALSIYNPLTKDEKIIYNNITTGSFHKAPVSAQYSNDESKIYLYTNEGINCRFNVYDTKSAKLLYTKLIKHASIYYETDDFLFLTGADAKGYGVTTKHDKTSYKELARWNKKEIVGITPGEKYGILLDYKQKRLQKLDLSNGRVIEWTPFDNNKLNINSLIFNKKGNQAFVAVINKYSKNPAPNKIGLFFYGVNVNENKVITEEVEIKKNESDAWVQYKSDNPSFKISFPNKAKETVTVNSKGRKTLKLLAGDKKNSYSVIVMELAKNYDKSKYSTLANTIATNFIKKGYAIVSEESFQVGNINTKKYLLKKKGNYHQYVSVCINGYSYQLFQISSKENKENALKFLNSIEFF